MRVISTQSLPKPHTIQNIILDLKLICFITVYVRIPFSVSVFQALVSPAPTGSSRMRSTLHRPLFVGVLSACMSTCLVSSGSSGLQSNHQNTLHCQFEISLPSCCNNAKAAYSLDSNFTSHSFSQGGMAHVIQGLIGLWNFLLHLSYSHKNWLTYVL